MDLVTLSMAKAYSDSKGGYTETKLVEVFNEVNFPINNEVEVSDSYYNTLDEYIVGENWAKDQNKVTVVWDGIKYDCYIWQYDGGEMEFGNSSFLLSDTDNGLPFMFYLEGTSAEVYARDPGEHTFTVTAVEEIVHPIDLKYLPSNSEVVTVNLADYEIEPTAELPVPNMNLAILSLFANSGGICTVPDYSNFWDIISDDKTVRFVIDASSMSSGLTIEAEAKSFVKNKGRLNAVETSFMVLYGDWHRVTMMFMNNFNSTSTIVVHVEPLNIPGA